MSKTITLNGWCVFLAIAAWLVSRPCSAFTAAISPQQIQPGQRATLEIRLSPSDLIQPLEQAALLPEAQDDWLLSTPGLEVLDQQYTKDGEDFVWRYAVTSYTPGSISIPPVAVVWGPQTFSSERSSLEVITTRASGDSTLRPNLPPVSAPWQWRRWLAVGLIAAAVAAAVYRLQHRFRIRRKKPPTAQPILPVELPEQWLRRQLLVLRSELEIPSNAPKVSDHWARTMREFTQRRRAAPVTAWTTRQIASKFGEDPKINALVGLLSQADRFRFPPHAQRPDGLSQAALHWIEESERLFL